MNQVETKTLIGLEDRPKYFDGWWDFRPLGVDLQIAVTTPDKKEEFQIKAARRDGSRPIHIREKFGLVVMFIVGEEFDVPDKPEDSSSKKHGSQMLYLVRSKDNKKLIQFAPAWAKSSEHGHFVPEEYYLVHGFMLIKGKDGYTKINPSNPFQIVPTMTFHEVKTLQVPAVSVLIGDFNEHIRR